MVGKKRGLAAYYQGYFVFFLLTMKHFFSFHQSCIFKTAGKEINDNGRKKVLTGNIGNRTR